MDKTTELYELHKIPDFELIKSLQVELGKLRSENDELLYMLSIKDHRQSKNSTYIRDMENQVDNLKKKIKSLEEVDTSKKLLEEIDYLRGELRLKNRKLDILEKQLLVS